MNNLAGDMSDHYHRLARALSELGPLVLVLFRLWVALGFLARPDLWNGIRGLWESASLVCSDIPADFYESTRQERKSLSPIERIAFYSSMFLGAQLFIVNESG